MAAAATDRDQEKIGGESNPSIYVEDLWDLDKSKASKVLEDLLIDDFAKQLQDSHPGELFQKTLASIKLELRDPYRERRMEFSPLEEKEIFYMLTGESPYTLKEDLIIPVTTLNENKEKTLVSLDCNINGFIKDINYSEKVPKGSVVMAKILKIDFEKFEVELSCHHQDLISRVSSIPYYDTQAEKKDVEEKKQQEQKNVKKIVRQINHPQFKNISHEEAIHFLKDKDIGEVIIRPSSKGYNTLNMIWKCGTDHYQNIEIKEESKLNNWSIGKVLKVEIDHFKEMYEDLDEIIARTIEPMAFRAKQICSHKKFKNVKESQLGLIITQEKQRDPRYNPYYLCKSEKVQGRYCLGFWTGSNVRYEIVTIKPDAFYFRGAPNKSVEDIIKSFKEDPTGSKRK